MRGGCKNNWGGCSQLLGTDGVHKQLMAALRDSDQLAGFDSVSCRIDLDGCVEWQQCVFCAVHGGYGFSKQCGKSRILMVRPTAIPQQGEHLACV